MEVTCFFQSSTFPNVALQTSQNMSPPFEVVAVEEILAVDFEGNFSFGGVIAACLARIMATIF